MLERFPEEYALKNFIFVQANQIHKKLLEGIWGHASMHFLKVSGIFMFWIAKHIEKLSEIAHDAPLQVLVHFSFTKKV